MAAVLDEDVSRGRSSTKLLTGPMGLLGFFTGFWKFWSKSLRQQKPHYPLVGIIPVRGEGFEGLCHRDPQSPR